MIAVLALAATAAGAAPKGGGKPSGGGGKGGGGSTGGSGSLTLSVTNDVNGDGLPNWGDSITFTVTSSTTEPHVNVTCSQGGTVVYGASTGYYASYPWPWTQIMKLSSQSWTGGAASCTATLQAYSGTSVTTLGTLNFQAYA